MSRRLFVVGNRFSGNKKTGKVLHEFSSFLQAKEIPFEIYDTNQDGNAILTTKRLDKAFTDLVVIGGDGTINESVNGLAYDIPVSIIPAGTGNDFVKNVTLGKTQRDQFETAIMGEVKRIDLGKCNDRIFLNGVGIGFDGQIVEDMASKRVPLLKGHAAYYYHVLRILGSYGVKTFEYQVDDRLHQEKLILLAVGNGTTFGGGFKLMPEAKVDDGLLEVCSIGDLSPIGRFLNIHRLSNGSHGKLGLVDFHQVKSLHVAENEMLFAHIDGERMGQPPFDFKVVPQSLRLRVANL
ncbi:MAG: diacylglycerol kinase family protein [Cyclobacteriaceae bacterium]